MYSPCGFQFTGLAPKDFCALHGLSETLNITNIRKYIEAFVSDKEKSINQRRGFAKGEEGYLSGHDLFIKPVLGLKARLLNAQDATVMFAVVVHASPSPQNPSDSYVQADTTPWGLTSSNNNRNNDQNNGRNNDRNNDGNNDKNSENNDKRLMSELDTDCEDSVKGSYEELDTDCEDSTEGSDEVSDPDCEDSGEGSDEELDTDSEDSAEDSEEELHADCEDSAEGSEEELHTDCKDSTEGSDEVLDPEYEDSAEGSDEELGSDCEEHIDGDNYEHGRAAFAVKSHTYKETQPDIFGIVEIAWLISKFLNNVDLFFDFVKPAKASEMSSTLHAGTTMPSRRTTIRRRLLIGT